MHIFSVLGIVFVIPFLCYFQKLQLLVVKNFWNNFCCIILLFACTQKVSQISLKSYFKLETLIFLPFVKSFLADMLTKSSFSNKNDISGEVWDKPYKRSYQKLTWQSIKGKFHHWQKLELCKVVHYVKLNWLRLWGCAFNSRKCIFLVFLFLVHCKILIVSTG